MKTVHVLVCLTVGSVLVARARATPQPANAEMAQGIRQAEEGDFESAILTLDSVVRRLEGTAGRGSEISLARLYLGMSYLGVGQLEKARLQMREAWLADRNLTLDPKKFPRRVMQAFEAAKAEARSTTPPEAQTPRGKGRSGKTLLIAGGATALAGAAALASSSSTPSSPSTSPAPVPTPQVLVGGSSGVSGPGVTTRFSAFTVPSAGVIQYSGNWTQSASTFSLELGQNCAGFGPYVAETPPSGSRPLTLIHTVSAGGTFCPYALYVSGTGPESFSYQVVFTPQ